MSFPLLAAPTDYTSINLTSMQDFQINAGQSSAYISEVDFVVSYLSEPLLNLANQKDTKWYISAPERNVKVEDNSYEYQTDKIERQISPLIAPAIFNVEGSSDISISDNSISSHSNFGVNIQGNIIGSGFLSTPTSSNLCNNNNISIRTNIISGTSDIESTSVSGGVFGGNLKIANNGNLTIESNQLKAASYNYAENAKEKAIELCSRMDSLYKSDKDTFISRYGNEVADVWEQIYATVEDGTYVYEPGFSSSGASGSVYHGTNLDISGNKDISIKNNSVTATGITSSSSSQGGVFYGSAHDQSSYGKLFICDNGNIEISGNNANRTTEGSDSSILENGFARGGAISLSTTYQLNIQNNESVVFEKNYTNNKGIYHLQSIYAQQVHSNKWSESVATFSAANGKKIEFRDTFYLPILEINADYTDAQGNTKEQTGKVILTGKYTEQHLNEILSERGENRTATADEISASRTSEVRGAVTVHAGTLSLQDGVILKADSLTVNSGATLEVDLTSDMEMFGLTESLPVVATLDSDLLLEEGAIFALYDGMLDLGGNDLNIADGTSIITNLIDLNKDNEVTLFSNVGSYTKEEVLVNINGRDAFISFNSTNAIVSVITVPEPGTATLSLLALSALACRRRRR